LILVSWLGRWVLSAYGAGSQTLLRGSYHGA